LQIDYYLIIDFYNCPGIYPIWHFYFFIQLLVTSFTLTFSTPVSISCREGQVVTNCLSFCLPGNVLISPSLFFLCSFEERFCQTRFVVDSFFLWAPRTGPLAFWPLKFLLRYLLIILLRNSVYLMNCFFLVVSHFLFLCFFFCSTRVWTQASLARQEVYHLSHVCWPFSGVS
jgi:hypothetical protein